MSKSSLAQTYCSFSRDEGGSFAFWVKVFKFAIVIIPFLGLKIVVDKKHAKMGLFVPKIQQLKVFLIKKRKKLN